MKVATVTRTNQKGQIVIPKKLRDSLGITPQVPLNIIVRGNKVIIQPIKELVTQDEESNYEISYTEILKKTKGSWKNEPWNELRDERKKTELVASKERKKKR